MFLSIFTNN